MFEYDENSECSKSFTFRGNQYCIPNLKMVNIIPVENAEEIYKEIFAILIDNGLTFQQARYTLAQCFEMVGNMKCN